jgi:hypothetical protein
MSEYLAAHLLEPQEVTEPFRVFPLHVTVLRWFTHPNEQQVIEIVRDITDQHMPFKLKAGALGKLGSPQTPVDVRFVMPQPELTSLHEKLEERLVKSGAQLVGKQYEGYKPHVTKKGRKELAADATISVNYLYLFGKEDKSKQKTVIGKFALGGATKNEAAT